MTLAVSGFSYRLLVPLGRVRLAFDFDLDDLEAARNPLTASEAFLVREAFEQPWGTGVLGIPASFVPGRHVQLRARGQGVIAALDELAHLYGIVGSIEVEAHILEDDPEGILAKLDERGAALLEELLAELPDLADDPARHGAALHVVLTYLGEQLTLVASPFGLVAELGSALAQRIAGLPLFDTGATTWVSASRMLTSFREQLEAAWSRGDEPGTIDWARELDPRAPEVVRTWLDTHLQPARVVMPASSSKSATATPAAEPDPDPARGSQPRDPNQPLTFDALAWNLYHWLERLRPDPRDDAPATRVWVVDHEVDSQPGSLVVGGEGRLDVCAFHPLAARVRNEPTPANLAWLLLALYAHLNAVTGLITNHHERAFSLCVGEALTTGELQLLWAPTELI